MDVLGLRGDCAIDDGLHLFWYSSPAAAQGKRTSSKLCRISISEFRISSTFCCASTRRAPRLVGFRSVQRLVLVRSLLPLVFAYTSSSRSQSPGGVAISAEVEHRLTRLPVV